MLLLGLATAEISLSVGQTSGTYLQDIRDDRGHSIRKSVYAGRPAFFYEIDSGNHPLWFSGDRVAFGLGIFAETRHRDYADQKNYSTDIPLYLNYYFKLTDNWSCGAGINFDIKQLRYKNETTTAGQQLGKNILFRYSNPADFYELGLIQGCSGLRLNDEIDVFYDSTNYIFKYGFYIEQNKF